MSALPEEGNFHVIATLPKVLTETLKITVLVFIMMVLVDLINVWTRGKIAAFLGTAKAGRQYLVASLLGVMPGCVGAFTNVSLYIHGLISFGALVGAMAAVSGDEAFVMLALFPRTALILFGMLFVVGIGTGWLVDRIIKRLHIQTCRDCKEQIVHSQERGFLHYLKDHVWGHVVRKHLWRTALWTLGALLLIEIGMQHWHLDHFTSAYPIALLFLGAVVGLIPESGPHLVFVTMYASGLIPFSVLFTSSFVQDGHGMLPMLSYSFKDSVLIKAFNVVFGTAIGLSMYAVGW
jgi:Putative, 10TM heavy-metal exporter